jgi:hypothetical protein
MAATLTELEDLEKAIRTGALSVRDRVGRMITYRSLADMRSARDEMRRELGLDPDAGKRRRVWSYTRGT